MLAYIYIYQHHGSYGTHGTHGSLLDPAYRLNEELNLPEKYIAVQIRRGDKVAGNRKVHRMARECWMQGEWLPTAE